MIEKKSVLITGIQGFLGRYLYNFLLRQKCFEIFGTDRIPDRLNIGYNHYFQGELQNQNDTEHIITTFQPSVVFHLAGVAHSENPEIFYDNNFFASYFLLEKMYQISQKGTYNPLIILLGTAAEYGANSNRPNSEEDELLPISHYGVSKSLQTYLAQFYARLGRLRVIIARPTNIIGPEQSGNFVVPMFAQEIVRMETGDAEPHLEVRNVSSSRDFIDVRDVIRALVLLVDAGKSGEVYNISSGNSVTIRDLAEKMCSLSRVPINIHDGENSVVRGSIHKQVSDFRKIKNTAGWKPEIPLMQSLEDILNQFRKKWQGDKVTEAQRNELKS